MGSGFLPRYKSSGSTNCFVSSCAARTILHRLRTIAPHPRGPFWRPSIVACGEISIGVLLVSSESLKTLQRYSWHSDWITRWYFGSWVSPPCVLSLMSPKKNGFIGHQYQVQVCTVLFFFFFFLKLINRHCATSRPGREERGQDGRAPCSFAHP